MGKRILLVIFIILIIICIDQSIKILVSNNLYNSSMVMIKGVLNLTYIENTGGAYGIGSNSTIMFIIINIIVIGLLTKFIVSKSEEIDLDILISVSLIIAGGVGNLIDRIFRGHVIDYIDINPIIKYPVFNIADICVFLGCIVIVIKLLYRRNK